MDKTKLVLSGGGVKGLCTLGLLHKMSELKMLDNIDTFCGTSVGGLISFLLLIGYTPKEMFEILNEIDFSLLFQYNIDDLFNDIHVGLLSQEPIIYVIGTLMKKRNCSIKITFKELFKKYNKKLIVTGVCINDSTLCYFNDESHPDMKVLDALKITMSIPLVFKPVKYKNAFYIDGGAGSNYPIDFFKEEDLENVIGILVKGSYEYIEKFNDHAEYFLQLMNCVFKKVFDINEKLYEKYTYYIETKNISFTEWNIDSEKKTELFEFGYNININNK